MDTFTSDVEQTKFPWGPIVIGALLVLIVQTASGLLAAGIGLAVFAPEDREAIPQALQWGGAVLAALTVFLSFFLGGWLVSFWSATPSRRMASLQGLAVWVVACALILFFAGTQIVSTLGTFLTQAGIGLGATGGADAALKSLEKVRIVSDLSVLKGKVVTQIDLPKTSNRTAVDSARHAGKEAETLKDEAVSDPTLREGAEKARVISAGASFAALASLLVGIFASWLGAQVGRPKSPSEGAVAAEPLRRSA